jgi:hypothetical protein
VVSMVTRQATAPAPRVERPRPAEPVALRQPEPLVAEPLLETTVELDADPIVASLAEPMPELEPAPVLPELTEVPVRPAVLDAVPSMAPAHVATATFTAPIGDRVSFKDLATKLLGDARESVEASAMPSVIEAPVVEPAPEPVVAPVELTLESPVVLETPQPVVASPDLEQIVALAAEAGDPEAEPAKPAAPPLPQGFEGLKFPNDGVLTRQWMEFLSQMSTSK